MRRGREGLGKESVEVFKGVSALAGVRGSQSPRLLFPAPAGVGETWWSFNVYLEIWLFNDKLKK